MKCPDEPLTCFACNVPITEQNIWDEGTCINCHEHATTMKTELRRALLDGLEEYISEAEHQDGPGYWTQFTNNKDALRDFVLYVDQAFDLGEQNTDEEAETDEQE